MESWEHAATRARNNILPICGESQRRDRASAAPVTVHHELRPGPCRGEIVILCQATPRPLPLRLNRELQDVRLQKKEENKSDILRVVIFTACVFAWPNVVVRHPREGGWPSALASRAARASPRRGYASRVCLTSMPHEASCALLWSRMGFICWPA